MKDLAIIACYIGERPWYFDLYIISCIKNPSIDFYLFLSFEPNLNKVPKNVFIESTDLITINECASCYLGITSKILSGYKLCDFKPTYGLLFQSRLSKYRFWAFSDIDVIYGNIRNFITKDLMEKYDIISIRHDFISGQFCLVKNNERMNNLFRESKDWKKVLESENHYCFDETGFKWDNFTEGLHYQDVNSEIESMTHVVKRLQEENKINVHFDFLLVEGIPGNIKWENGKIYYKNKFEALMYHFVLFKKLPYKTKIPDREFNFFQISSSRIYNFKYL